MSPYQEEIDKSNKQRARAEHNIFLMSWNFACLQKNLCVWSSLFWWCQEPFFSSFKYWSMVSPNYLTDGVAWMICPSHSASITLQVLKLGFCPKKNEFCFTRVKGWLIVNKPFVAAPKILTELLTNFDGSLSEICRALSSIYCSNIQLTQLDGHIIYLA